jgi:thiamine-monophosphate kinase
MADKRTEISELGEFGLIGRIKSNFSIKNASTVLGIDDDAAVIEAGDHYLLVSTDMLLEGVHFDLAFTPLKHLGYKVVAVNVSDIAAMNGFPKQLTVSIGVSNRFSVEAVEALYDGIKMACEAYEVDLVGGDTTASASGLVISVTILGEVNKNKLVRRNSANEKEIICVTGDLGAAYMGLQILEREKQVFLENPDMQPQLENYGIIVGRQLKPEARMDIIYELKDKGIVPTSMIDISDGLASDLFHICNQSGVGATLYEDKLPIDEQTYQTAGSFKIDPVTCVMNGGEDYELLFTIKQDDFEKLKNHPDIHFIGYIQAKDKGINLVTKAENVVPLQAQGWDHFHRT